MSTAVSAAPAVAATKPRRARLTAAKRRQYGAAYALVLPFFIVFVAMVIVPLVYAGYLSLYRKRLIGGTSFAGAENYIRALTDPLFLGGVGRMAIFLIIQVPFMIALSLFFALALDSGMMKLAKFGMRRLAHGAQARAFTSIRFATCRDLATCWQAFGRWGSRRAGLEVVSFSTATA